ncbi:MAG: hypothetical protein IPJ03_02000 [Ignavibacteriales bacterium]|nr:hypothetical protein [Ignavibacteriales bacterium]
MGKLQTQIVISDKRKPISLHANWFLKDEKFKIISERVEYNVFKKIELSLLILLMKDRLHTKAWSKTLVARFSKSGKSLSPIGSLTATYMVLESMRFYKYHEYTENIKELNKYLNQIITKDGIVIHNFEPTSSGANQIKPEELRHTSGYFLIRAMTVKKPTDNDKRVLQNIFIDLKTRYETRKKNSDVQGTAFAFLAALEGIYWIKEYNRNDIKILKKIVDYFIELEQLSIPGHPNWSDEQAASAASNTAPQWIVVWLLSTSLSWKVINIAKRKMLADRLLHLIEANIDLKQDNKELLPHSFSGSKIRKHEGESLLATGIALYLTLLVYTIFKDKKILARAEYCLFNLIDRINTNGFAYSTKGSLEKPLEGYLAWAGCLLGVRPLIYNEKNFIKSYGESPRLDKNPEEIIKDIQTSLNNGLEMVFEASDIIDKIYKDANVKVYNKGFFQPLEEIKE